MSKKLTLSLALAGAALVLAGCAAPPRPAPVAAPAPAAKQVLPRDPASAPTACRIALNTKTLVLQLRTAEGNRQCKAGDTLHVRLYRYNSFVVEQLCDLTKPVIRNGETDPVDETYLCTMTGRVMDPTRKGAYGVQIKF